MGFQVRDQCLVSAQATYFKRGVIVESEALMLSLARRRDLQSVCCRGLPALLACVMLLIDKILRDLQRLHLGHGLAVALRLAVLAPMVALAARTHRCDLRLKDGAVVAHRLFRAQFLLIHHAGIVASCYDFLVGG